MPLPTSVRFVFFGLLLGASACGGALQNTLTRPARHEDGAHRHAFAAALREGAAAREDAAAQEDLAVAPRALGRVAAAAPVPRTHTVQRGDTLYSLARNHGVSVHELAALNNLQRPQDLQAGTQLRLPPLPAAEGDAAAAASTDGLSQAGGAAGSNLSPAQARVAELAGHPVTAGSRVEGAATGPVGGLSTSGDLRWPIAGRVTSQFGRRAGRPHDGIDIGAKPGTDVLAAADGDVVFADAHGGYGNVVILRHGNGLLTIYAHSERNLVRRGQHVRAGESIARVGNTGRSRGPHLHFEVRQGTRPQNPMRYLQPAG